MSRVAVVTGGASGIGQAISHRLAKCGNKVAIFDQQGEALNDQVAALQANGFQAIAFNVEVTDRSAVDAAVASVATSSGLSKYWSPVLALPHSSRSPTSPSNSGTARWRSI